MEVRGIAGQNDHAAGRIRLHPIAIEALAETDVEDAGHDGIDAVLRMPVRHQLYAGGNLDPDDVGTGFGGMADEDGKASRRRKRREWLPVDVLGQN